MTNANWYGWHAVSKACAKCWAMVRATSRRRKSPTTSPRAPPEGFWGATSLLMLRACAAVSGMLPCATRWQTSTKAATAAGSSNKTLATSAVKPLGPGAVPRRARRKLVVSNVDGKWHGDWGAQVRMFECMG